MLLLELATAHGKREISSRPVILFVACTRELRVLGKLCQDNGTREPRVPTNRTSIYCPFPESLPLYPRSSQQTKQYERTRETPLHRSPTCRLRVVERQRRSQELSVRILGACLSTGVNEDFTYSSEVLHIVLQDV